MTESESVALPLGDTPIFSSKGYYSRFSPVCQYLFRKNLPYPKVFKKAVSKAVPKAKNGENDPSERPPAFFKRLFQSICKEGVFGNPLFQFDGNPEAVNAKGDEGQQEPFDPVAEQLNGFAVESQASAFDYGVLDFPVVEHAVSPGQADAKRDACNDPAQNRPTDFLKQTAVKIGSVLLFAHVFRPPKCILLQRDRFGRNATVWGNTHFQAD